MASAVSQRWKHDTLRALVDIDGGAFWWCALLCTNTTVDTEVNVNVFDSYTTLDEHPSQVRKALSGVTLTRDDANARIEWDFNDPAAWTALANGTRQIQGVVYYLDDDDDGDPGDDALGHNSHAVFAEFPAPIHPDGSDFEVMINAEGALWAT